MLLGVEHTAHPLLHCVHASHGVVIALVRLLQLLVDNWWLPSLLLHVEVQFLEIECRCGGRLRCVEHRCIESDT